MPPVHIILSLDAIPFSDRTQITHDLKATLLQAAIDAIPSSRPWLQFIQGTVTKTFGSYLNVLRT